MGKSRSLTELTHVSCTRNVFFSQEEEGYPDVYLKFDSLKSQTRVS